MAHALRLRTTGSRCLDRTAHDSSATIQKVFSQNGSPQTLQEMHEDYNFQETPRSSLA